MVQIRGGGVVGAKILSTYQIVSICNDYRISDNFRIGVKLSRRGKSSLGGVKYTMWALLSETVKCAGSNS